MNQQAASSKQATYNTRNQAASHNYNHMVRQYGRPWAMCGEYFVFINGNKPILFDKLKDRMLVGPDAQMVFNEHCMHIIDYDSE
jgi:hypothetical protein